MDSPATSGKVDMNFDSSNATSEAAMAQPYEYSLEDDDNELLDEEAIGNFDVDDRFSAPKPVWNDTSLAIYFLCVFLIFLVIGIKNIIKHFSEYKEQVPLVPGTSNLEISFGLIMLALIATVVSIAISAFVFIVAGRYPHVVTLKGSQIIAYLGVIFGLFSLFVEPVTGIFSILVGSFIMYVLYYHKNSISLASNVLSESIKVFKKYPSTVGLVMGTSVLVLTFSVFMNISIATTYIDHGYNADGTPVLDDNGNTTSKFSFSLIWSLLSVVYGGLYTVDVLNNVISVTIAGIYGTWYYTNSTFMGVPSNECLSSFIRAFTYSFGSICFGSLFVVAVQAISVAFKMTHPESAGVLGLIFQLIIGILAQAASYLNTYICVYLGIYGVDFRRSVESVINFMKKRGKESFRKDIVIAFSMVVISFLAALVNGLFTALYLIIFGKLFGFGSNHFLALILYSIQMTFYVTSIVCFCVTTGGIAFFVALSKDPSVYSESNPFEYQEIIKNYPEGSERLD
ncbi:hypothetical protein DAMA08_034390 [Martiniozyma asiatica (nom. inval.)]|nr:hypothetical protein DAMA08_034390 [Martiniozyma asiatica]